MGHRWRSPSGLRGRRPPGRGPAHRSRAPSARPATLRAPPSRRVFACRRSPAHRGRTDHAIRRSGLTPPDRDRGHPRESVQPPYLHFYFIDPHRW